MTVFHQIDRILFWLILLGALFAGCMALSGEQMLFSAVFACAACLGMKRVFRTAGARMKGRSRKVRKQYARAELSRWALLPAHEAKENVIAIFKDFCQAEGPLLLLPLSPASKSFDADAVISAWKNSQGESHITLAALCPANEEAMRWAEKLEHPTVSLIDGPMLEKRIMESCRVVPDSFRKAKRSALPSDWGRRFLKRIQPVKAGLYALLMLLLYLLSGGQIRLIAFGVFLALALLSLREHSVV